MTRRPIPLSPRTTQLSKRFLYGICAGRQIDPGGYSVGGTTPDSWLPQVCRVCRFKTAINHSARSKPVPSIAPVVSVFLI